MKIRLATFAASLTALAYVALAPHSGASPDDCTLYDSRLCGDWGKVTFCPDTGIVRVCDVPVPVADHRPVCPRRLRARRRVNKPGGARTPTVGNP